jgi:predicted amidohydrolase YtcJ
MTSSTRQPPTLDRRAALALGAGALLAPALGRAQAPGLILTGGAIHTGTAAGRVEALAIQGDRIAFAGPLDDARRRVPGARTVDLAGGAAFPGFVDSHVHLTAVGLREMTLNLEGCASIAELQARLRDWAARNPKGVITGRGWIETHWPEHRFPTRDDLDAVVADRPVYLGRSDGHAGLVNSRALEFLGIGPSTPTPAGGEILKDADGRPTGLFVDNAQTLLARILPAPDRATRREALARADRLYASRGWTGVHSMSVAEDDLNLLRERDKAGELGLRVDNYMDIWEAGEVLATGPSVNAAGRVRLRGIKLYADGALGSRGAALLAPYSDKPGWMGLIRTPREAMVEAMRKAKAVNAQVAVHAIGDRGNRLALDSIAGVLGEARTDRRWRIEHAQVLAASDIPRFAALGVTASMQPSHAIGDLYFAPARLGPERLKGAYAWRTLIASGALVCAGTDAPVEKGDPLIEFYAAVYRHALDGFAGPDWGLDEAVSREQALAMITLNAARAVGREADLGTLEAGKRADVSVFSTDLTSVEPADIPKARALLTIADGRIVHQV